MQMTGEYRIPASREKVWEALNDPEVLKASIPGCEELEKTGENSMAAKVKAKVGPVSAKFSGEVTLSDLNPPESYTISGEGKGGAAGFARGGAKVHLTADGDATILTYEADAKVGGKLAQIGSRLIDGTAKKMADEFFTRFSEQLGGGAAAAPTPEEAAQPEAESGEAESGEAVPEEAKATAATAAVEAAKEVKGRRSYSPVSWIFMIVAVVVILWIVFGGGAGQ